jgi:rubrerythrin
MTTTEHTETLEERIQRGIEDGTIVELKSVLSDADDQAMLAENHKRLLDEFRSFRPTHDNWWTRSTLRRLIRIAIGLHDDVQKGSLFEQLVMSNIVQQANLLKGVRNDLDAATRVQNPVNSQVVDLHERLSFYERHNDSLISTHRKLVRIRTDAQIKREREAAANARKAAKKELKDHAQFGELIDCRTCGKNVDGPDEKCPECNGLGVVPNPDYIPPPEETHGADSQEERGASGPQLVAD